jgi:hypothetical protein
VPYTLAQMDPGAQYFAVLQAVHAACIIGGALATVAVLAEARIIETANGEEAHWIAMFLQRQLDFLLRASVTGSTY